MELKLNRCTCGRVPRYYQERECYGHGEYPMIGRVVCSCGENTKGFIVDGFYGEITTKDDVINFWNKKHPSCDFCSTFDIVDVDPENLYISRCVSSCNEARVNMFINAHGKRGLYFDILHWFPGHDTANTVGIYKPKFCPECGRDLRKINGFIKGEKK